jgi:hypothetical protein
MSSIIQGVTLHLTSAEALTIALERTGLGPLGKVHDPVLVVAHDLHVPFIGEKYEGRTVWEVCFEDVCLKLPSQTEECKEQHTRKFRVRLDADTGQVIVITSVLSESRLQDPEAPPDWYAEEQLWEDGERYLGLPKEVPPISFLEATDGILRGRYANPFSAKEIHAVCVLMQIREGDVRPGWAITLNGILVAFHGGYVPESQRDHLRIIVDAQTGKAVMGTTCPQREPRFGWIDEDEKAGRRRQER